MKITLNKNRQLILEPENQAEGYRLTALAKQARELDCSCIF
jgi:hypothetical protein